MVTLDEQSKQALDGTAEAARKFIAALNAATRPMRAVLDIFAKMEAEQRVIRQRNAEFLRKGGRRRRKG